LIKEIPLQFLEKLNPQQREAVETVHGPVLILAGAGSGKTRVITYRIAYLVEQVGVAPDSILAMTFTNKAAAEMGERVSHLIGARTLAKPVISTFHSFCVRLLRRDIEALQVNGKGYRKDFAIYDESDQQALVKSAMKRLGIDDKQLTPRTVLSRISHAKNHLLDPQEVYLQSDDPKMERVAQIYKVYESELAKCNALDFDDLLLKTNQLLKSSSEVRERYNRRFQYILIDEYQDTNRPQYEIMRALAGAEHNVCAVGDEDQSIYSWRGADIRNILEFEQDFPEAKIVRLEQNYRSTQNILEAASAVVKNNLKRKGKNLWTERLGGAKVGYYEAPDGENESLFAADYINKYLQTPSEDDEPKRAAVLYRTNSQSRLMEEAMRRYNIKYNVVGGFSFYERAEIKDMISYLKLIQNPSDSMALLRVINTPTRGIGKTTIEQIERIALETNLPLWDALGYIVDQRLMQPRACAALKSFREVIEDAREMLYGKFEKRLVETAQPETLETNDAAEPESEDEGDLQHTMNFDFEDIESGAEEFSPEALSEDAAEFSPETMSEAEEAAPAKVDGFRAPGENANVAEVLKFLIDRTGYIKQLEAEDTPESLARIENLRELVNAAMDSRDRGETLSDFLDHAALVSDTDDIDASARVTLMTLHAAKGLEFPLVFMVGMEEGLFPHSRTLMNPDEIEEERRICYVGMTRAMRILVLSRARYRRRYGTDMPEASTASRFLSEIPPELFEDIGSSRKQTPVFADTERHYAYEDEDQRPQYGRQKQKTTYGGNSTYNSIDNIAEFFASRGKKFSRPSVPVEEPVGKRGFRPGQKVKHPKYGEGTVYQREGDGEEAKITVQFPRFGLKKLVEKFAQLEKA
jgi:DNA helicase-2/ATP-dependent DNA helicase PcrA